MLIHGRSIGGPRKWQTDVLIIGSGPAGITLACELASKNKAVMLMEAGSERFEPAIQSHYQADNVSYPYPDPTKSRLRQLGGTSNHWANNTSPFSPADFEQRDWLGIPGWPISYKEIAPFYSEAAKYCGVGQEPYSAARWQGKHGIPDPIKPNNPLIEMGIARAAIPPTRFFDSNKATLIGHENITIVDHADFQNLLWSSGARRAEGAMFLISGHACTVHAQTVVMCMGGLENARMLLIENARHNNEIGNQGDTVGRYFMDHPTLRAAHLFGINGALFEAFKGRLGDDYTKFTLGFYQLTEHAVMSENVSNIRMPLEKSTRLEMSEGVSSLHSIKQILTGKSSVSYAVQHLSQAALELDLIAQSALNKVSGPQIFKTADAFAGYQISLMMEQAPDRNNRIVLSSKKDEVGRPKLSLQWRVTESDKARLWRGLEVFASGIAFDGVGRVKILKHQASRLFADQLGFGHHHMGATRMSDSPEHGVVDRNLKVHGTENLYVAGCSVFSTGSHVPPTLTIVALSIRLAQTLSLMRS